MIVAWLEPIALANGGGVAGKRRPGDPLPFWLVSRVAGPDDKVTDYGNYSVHSLAEDLAAANEWAMLAHRRMLVLGPPLVAQQRVTISGGRTVFADKVATDLFPRYEYYSDTIDRFVARYDVDLRFVAV
jgi:hypothetical protein